jgi:hypothetical protein
MGLQAVAQRRPDRQRCEGALVTEEAWRKKVRDLAAASTAPLQTVEIADDVPVGTLVRALAAGGLTISNVTGRGLRIVRAPTPETSQEDER